MPNEEPNEKIIFKELGPLQQKALFYLAENPNNFKQTILKGIQHPLDQHSALKNAVNALDTQGYIKSKEARTQKKVKTKKYYCTELGVFYALTRNPNPNILKILDSYKQQIDLCKQLRALYIVWGKDQFAMFLKDIHELLPIIQNNRLLEATPYLLIKIKQRNQNIDPKIIKKNAKAAFKQYPELRQMLTEGKQTFKDMVKNLDEMLE